MEKLSAAKIISLLSADAMRYFFPGYSAMESDFHEIRFRIHDSVKVAHRAEKTHDYLSEDKQASPAKSRERYSHKFKQRSSLLFETEEFPDDEFFPAAPAAESFFPTALTPANTKIDRAAITQIFFIKTPYRYAISCFTWI